ncbi:MAG TPA: hypothetical protein VN231_00140 [Allosphingosinicella sp.]|nr:hypothetical protein [Allosphingosinicella sp.]
MEGLSLTPEERSLREAIQEARPAVFSSGERIRAEVLRRIVLQLPLDLSGSGPVTAAGIELQGAVIDGRLDLEGVGGPLCALEFRDCRFEGGFSGAHGHFSRLSFAGCRFRDIRSPHELPLLPTIDLESAAIDSDLDMDRIRPDREHDFLWVSARGARIDGALAMSQATLRAPPQQADRLQSDKPRDALDLALADIHGDLIFLNGSRSEGRISLRGGHVQGSVWLSGAEIDNRGDKTLFFQLAQIDGALMLNGMSDRVDGQGQFRAFRANGLIDLLSARIGGDLCLSNCQIDAGDGWVLNAAGAEIGGRFTIDSATGERSICRGQIVLDNATISGNWRFCDVEFGLEREPYPAISAVSAKVAQVLFFEVWPAKREFRRSLGDPEVKQLSVDFTDLHAEKIHIESSRLSGYLRAVGLCCSGDVTLKVRVGGEVDLAGCSIGGSLDLSNLGFEPLARGLSLRDGEVSRALKIVEPDHVKAGLRRKMLVAARRITLSCLPGTDLVETLWSDPRASDNRRLFQAGFLVRGEELFPLEGESFVFHGFVTRYGHTIDGIGAAREYLRLFCAYLQAAIGDGGEAGAGRRAERRSAFPIIEGRAALPPLIHVDQEGAKRQLEALEAAFAQGGEDAPDEATLADARRLAEIDSLDNLAPELLELNSEQEEEPGCFRFGACILFADRLFRSQLRLKVVPDQVLVEMSDDRAFGPLLGGVPRWEGLQIHHPEQPAADSTPWVTPPSLDGMETVSPRELERLAARLIVHLEPSFSIQGRVDLTDLACDTLDDEAGRYWGWNVRIEMNHFTYSRTTWEKSAAEAARSRSDRWRGALFGAAAEWLPLWLVRTFGWTDALRAARPASPWLTRRNWIFQQFDTQHLPSPARFRIGSADYRPQPFEQAIKVARAEGREDYAINFEILKRRIEWRLFTRRNRWAFASLAALGAVLWLLFGPEQNWPESLAVAATIFLLITFASDIANFVMGALFGYLRRPVRAIATLVGAFLIGWIGVHAANERGMLVIDVEPVASLVDRSGMTVGSEVTSDPQLLASNVPCGRTINEALYALDVLIPLVDLREETGCEVGLAAESPAPHSAAPPEEPASPASRIAAATLDSPTFWAVLKALYAILGWIIVSLAILTFAQNNRARGDSA